MIEPRAAADETSFGMSKDAPPTWNTTVRATVEAAV